MEGLEAAVRQILAEEIQAVFPAEELTDTFPLIDNEVLDSMGIFQLVELLEDRYDVVIDDGELVPENFATISAIVSLVRAKSAT